MNMKTAREYYRKKYGVPDDIKDADLPNLNIFSVYELMEEFKSPSPVSQQLTEQAEKIFKKWASHKDTCEVRYEANGDCDCGWYKDLQVIRQLSVSPPENIGAQKEIEHYKGLYEQGCSIIDALNEQLTSKESDVNRAVEALEEASKSGRSYPTIIQNALEILYSSLKGNK